MPANIYTGPTPPVGANIGDIYVVPSGPMPLALGYAGGFRSNTVIFLISNQLQATAAGFATSGLVWTCPAGEVWVVAAANVRFGTAAGQACAVTVEQLPAATASGSGTAQLTGTMSVAGTNDTAVNGALIAVPNTCSAGQGYGLLWSGTATSLANCVVTVEIRRVS